MAIVEQHHTYIKAHYVIDAVHFDKSPIYNVLVNESGVVQLSKEMHVSEAKYRGPDLEWII